MIAILVPFLAACTGGVDSTADAADDTTAVEAAAPGTDAGPADTEPWVVDVAEAGDAPTPHAWVRDRSTGGTDAGTAMVTGIRSARHDGYDRVVLEFDAHVPAYTIEYVDKPQYDCGSGEANFVEGDGWLQLALTGVHNHTDEGRPTTARRVDDPAGSNLRELRRICDFEAHVTWIVGVASPNEYRAFTLDQPARLIVDIRH